MRYEKSKSAFSLIEVVLAIGIFLVTILALVGLLGPTLKSVDDVDKTDEIVSVVNTLNAFLQNSPDINPNGSNFNAVFEAVRSGNFATVLIFKEYANDTGTNVRIRVGFVEGETTGGETLGADAVVLNNEFTNAPQDMNGSIYRAVLSPSSVIPVEGTDFNGASVTYRNTDRVDGIYPLDGSLTLARYAEGYFAMEVRIFAEDPVDGYDPSKLPPHSSDAPNADLANLNQLTPLFTYNTAIVR